ncbi:hypothetical protein NEPAR07_0851 [Nematocida parisii]|nr:hypothetical protein NEPAR07_0851 [Nematocida parisii]
MPNVNNLKILRIVCFLVVITLIGLYIILMWWIVTKTKEIPVNVGLGNQERMELGNQESVGLDNQESVEIDNQEWAGLGNEEWMGLCDEDLQIRRGRYIEILKKRRILNNTDSDNSELEILSEAEKLDIQNDIRLAENLQFNTYLYLNDLLRTEDEKRNAVYNSYLNNKNESMLKFAVGLGKSFQERMILINEIARSYQDAQDDSICIYSYISEIKDFDWDFFIQLSTFLSVHAPVTYKERSETEEYKRNQQIPEYTSGDVLVNLWKYSDDICRYDFDLNWFEHFEIDVFIKDMERSQEFEFSINQFESVGLQEIYNNSPLFKTELSVLFHALYSIFSIPEVVHDLRFVFSTELLDSIIYNMQRNPSRLNAMITAMKLNNMPAIKVHIKNMILLIQSLIGLLCRFVDPYDVHIGNVSQENLIFITLLHMRKFFFVYSLVNVNATMKMATHARIYNDIYNILCIAYEFSPLLYNGKELWGKRVIRQNRYELCRIKKSIDKMKLPTAGKYSTIESSPLTIKYVPANQYFLVYFVDNLHHTRRPVYIPDGYINISAEHIIMHISKVYDIDYKLIHAFRYCMEDSCWDYIEYPTFYEIKYKSNSKIIVFYYIPETLNPREVNDLMFVEFKIQKATKENGEADKNIIPLPLFLNKFYVSMLKMSGHSYQNNISEEPPMPINRLDSVKKTRPYVYAFNSSNKLLTFYQHLYIDCARDESKIRCDVDHLIATHTHKYICYGKSHEDSYVEFYSRKVMKNEYYSIIIDATMQPMVAYRLEDQNNHRALIYSVKSRNSNGYFTSIYSNVFNKFISPVFFYKTNSRIACLELRSLLFAEPGNKAPVFMVFQPVRQNIINDMGLISFSLFQLL